MSNRVRSIFYFWIDCLVYFPIALCSDLQGRSGEAMVLAVLDNKYKVESLLEEYAHTRVYLARDLADRPFLVKVISDADVFFEEMARHFALDDLGGTARLIDNYPALMVSGDTFMFADDMAALFGVEDYDFNDPESMLASPLAELGVLVIERIQGTPFMTYCAKLDELSRLGKLLELVGIIERLHNYGECHGDLVAPNVYVDDETSRVVLLDLGYFPEKTLPEGQFRAPGQSLVAEDRDSDDVPALFDEGEYAYDLDPSDDVYMLVRNFLAPMKWRRARLDGLITRGLLENSENRPSLEKVRKTLELWETTLESQAVPIWRRIMIPTGVMAALVLAFFVGLWVGKWKGRPSLESGKSQVTWVEMQELTPAQRRQWVLAMDRMAASGEVKKPMAQDFISPVAVFNHPEDPLLVGREFSFRLGDKVDIDGSHSVVAAIGSDYVMVHHNNAFRIYTFLQTVFQSNESHGAMGWYLWQNERNLPRVLSAAANLLDGWEEVETLDPYADLAYLLRRHQDRLEIANDEVFGFFPATGARHFLLLLGELVEVKAMERHWQVSRREDLPPLYLSFQHYLVDSVTVKSFANQFSDMTGLTVVSPPSLDAQVLPRRLFSDVLWQDILDALGFEWSLDVGEKGLTVTIYGVNI